MMVPALRFRVLAAWLINAGKSKHISLPALGRPNSFPLRRDTSGKWILPPSHASPSSSGVTATGEALLGGLLWTKPNPLDNSGAIRLRSDTSFMSKIGRAHV